MLATWRDNARSTQSVGEQTTLVMSTSLNGADAVKVSETVGVGESSLTPEITTRQVGVRITVLHVYDVRQ